jgi:hypothetical protein
VSGKIASGLARRRRRAARGIDQDARRRADVDIVGEEWNGKRGIEHRVAATRTPQQRGVVGDVALEMARGPIFLAVGLATELQQRAVQPDCPGRGRARRCERIERVVRLEHDFQPGATTIRRRRVVVRLPPFVVDVEWHVREQGDHAWRGARAWHRWIAAIVGTGVLHHDRLARRSTRGDRRAWCGIAKRRLADLFNSRATCAPENAKKTGIRTLGGHRERECGRPRGSSLAQFRAVLRPARRRRPVHQSERNPYVSSLPGRIHRSMQTVSIPRRRP